MEKRSNKLFKAFIQKCQRREFLRKFQIESKSVKEAFGKQRYLKKRSK